MRRLIYIGLGIVVVAGGGAWWIRAERLRKAEKEAIILGIRRPDETELDRDELKQLASFAIGVDRASSFTLYEGLPHQMFEADALKHEVATRKTVVLHRYHFYERPLVVSAAEVEQWKNIATSSSSFWSWTGMKLCGGFHPDYALRWNGTDYDLLMCFGCGEALLKGPKCSMTVDVRREVRTVLENTLKPHRDQRPLSQDELLDKANEGKPPVK